MKVRSVASYLHGGVSTVNDMNMVFGHRIGAIRLVSYLLSSNSKKPWVPVSIRKAQDILGCSSYQLKIAKKFLVELNIIEIDAKNSIVGDQTHYFKLNCARLFEYLIERLKDLKKNVSNRLHNLYENALLEAGIVKDKFEKVIDVTSVAVNNTVTAVAQKTVEIAHNAAVSLNNITNKIADSLSYTLKNETVSIVNLEKTFNEEIGKYVDSVSVSLLNSFYHNTCKSDLSKLKKHLRLIASSEYMTGSAFTLTDKFILCQKTFDRVNAGELGVKTDSQDALYADLSALPQKMDNLIANSSETQKQKEIRNKIRNIISVEEYRSFFSEATFDQKDNLIPSNQYVAMVWKDKYEHVFLYISNDGANAKNVNNVKTYQVNAADTLPDNSTAEFASAELLVQPVNDVNPQHVDEKFSKLYFKSSDHNLLALERLAEFRKNFEMQNLKDAITNSDSSSENLDNFNLMQQQPYTPRPKQNLSSIMDRLLDGIQSKIISEDQKNL